MAETLEAALQAAWEALDRGDTDGARGRVQAARALDAEAPEVDTLEGAIAAQEGDADGAMAAFKRAMQKDAEYFEPAYLAAQLAAAQGDLEDALETSELALDAAEEEEDYLDALLLKAEIELALDDPDAAAETLTELPPVDMPEAQHHVRAGGCLLELEDLEGAERHFSSAARLDPSNADAHHGLGLVAEVEGRDPAKVEHWKKVRELDLEEPVAPWRLPEERLEACVEAALGHLPERARALVGNVPILLEDYPSALLVDEGVDPRSLGLFTGTPFPEQSALGAPPHLEHVLLFQRNLEREARTPEEVEEEITITLLHETGHFFGMDEDDLEEVGLD